MTSIQVDPELLARAAERLAGYLPRIDELATCPTIGNLGDPRLVSRVVETDDEIGRAVSRAGEAISSMSQALRSAAVVYADADAGVAAGAAGAPSLAETP